MHDAEAVLVRKSQAGDRAAFEQLVRNTARLIHARIYLETGDAQGVEDLVQETFLLAWRSIRQVTDPSGFRSWLFSVAHSTVVDSARRGARKKRSGARAAEGVLDGLPSSSPGPPDAAALNEERQRVLEMLRALPDEYREPLALRYLAGADYDTITRQLGLSNGALRGLLGRGLHLLRSRLTRQTHERPLESQSVP